MVSRQRDVARISDLPREVQLINLFFSSRRRHTRSKRDWSSDVCSSDLLGELHQILETRHGAVVVHDLADDARGIQEIGRASCRERVESSGVVVLLKKTKDQKI